MCLWRISGAYQDPAEVCYLPETGAQFCWARTLVVCHLSVLEPRCAMPLQCACLTALKMEPRFRGSLLRLHPVGVPSWNLCQSGLPCLFPAAPLQFFFPFWTFRVPTLSSSTSRFPEHSLLVSRCSPPLSRSHSSQLSLDSDRLPLAESPSTVGPCC